MYPATLLMCTHDSSILITDVPHQLLQAWKQGGLRLLLYDFGQQSSLSDLCLKPLMQSLMIKVLVQNSPIAKRWEGLFAYLVLGYAAAFMTRGATAVDSAIQGAKIGFVIYAVSLLSCVCLQSMPLLLVSDLLVQGMRFAYYILAVRQNSQGQLPAQAFCHPRMG